MVHVWVPDGGATERTIETACDGVSFKKRAPILKESDRKETRSSMAMV